MIDKDGVANFIEITEKYGINKNDPLFAFIEIQKIMLDEIKSTKNELFLVNEDNDLKKMLCDIRDDFIFLSENKQVEFNKDFENFMATYKQKQIKEFKDLENVFSNMNKKYSKQELQNKNNFSIGKYTIAFSALVIGLSVGILIAKVFL